MIIFLYYPARIILWFVIIVCTLNLATNIVLTYFGYGTKEVLKGCILRKRWTASLIIILSFVILNINIYLEKLVNHSPFPIDKYNLVGTWKKDNRKFRLNDGGTVDFFEKPIIATKKVYWQVDDVNCVLEIRDQANDLLFKGKIKTFNGAYRIVETGKYNIEGNCVTDLGFSKE